MYNINMGGCKIIASPLFYGGNTMSRIVRKNLNTSFIYVMVQREKIE